MPTGGSLSGWAHRVQVCPTPLKFSTTPQWRHSYDLDMSYMGAMGYRMLIEDVLEKNFEHPHVVVGLILVMFYLLENMCPNGSFCP